MQLKWVLALLVVSILVFLVGFGSYQYFRPTKAGIQVITTDQPAIVFLNDKYLDRTPLIERNLKPGTYTLRIEPEDSKLAKYETEISLNPNTLTVVTWSPAEDLETSGGVIYELKKINGEKAAVYFTSIPDKATIKFADKPVDFTPLKLDDLEPGEYQYEVSLPSYETQKHTVSLKGGWQTNVTIKLAKLEEKENN